MASATLNLRLEAPYSLQPEVSLTSDECNGWEPLALQRCGIGGIRALIVRPESHEIGEGHGPAYLEIVAEDHLRRALSLEDDDVVAVATGDDAACWARAQPRPAPPARSRRRPADPRKLILRNFQLPGDIG